jgi:hypothetical protein
MSRARAPASAFRRPGTGDKRDGPRVISRQVESPAGSEITANKGIAGDDPVQSESDRLQGASAAKGILPDPLALAIACRARV